MPDNIATINGKAAMVFQNALPWHRLGTQQTRITSVDQALKLGQLDWEVKLEPMYYVDRVANPIRYKKVPSRLAVVRTTDSVCLGTVGETYEPLQNRPAFEVLDLAVSEFGVTIETAGALGNGERVWMLAKLPEDIEVVPGDKIDGYFLIATGHDGATPYTGRPTPVRVVCQNTIELAFASSKAIIRLTHVKRSQDQLVVVRNLIRDLIKTLKLTGESFAQLAARKVTPFEVREYVEAVLSIESGAAVSGIIERRRAKIIDLTYNGKGANISPESLWNAYNAVTEYVDHVRPGESTTIYAAKKATESALFGTNAFIKARALNLALKMLPA
jgi:phage/plasmid-like protein (TIGR03299 family)